MYHHAHGLSCFVNICEQFIDIDCAQRPQSGGRGSGSKTFRYVPADFIK